METLAFTHVAAMYEAPGKAPSLREFTLEIPTGVAIVGVTGSVAALSVVMSAPDAHALIQRGEVCAEVGNLQRALVSLNYSIGVDNVFGPTTESAVRSYQTDRGLMVDGVVGPATAAALNIASDCSVDDGSTGGGDRSDSNSLATVNASGLNVRTGPSTANAVITTLSRNTRVEVTATSGDWSSIVTGSTEGWVASAYLATVTDSPPDTEDGTAGAYTISTSSGEGVNVRATPNGAIAYGLADGATVTVTATRQTAGGYTWAELSNGNWVATAFLASGGSTGGGSTGGGSARTYTVDTPSNSGVNVRTSPNGVLAYGLAEGATVRVSSDRQMAGGYTWAQLTDGNWVATSFLR